MESHQTSFSAPTMPIILTFFMLLVGILPVFGNTSCTAGKCKLGGNTSITCEFNTDVKEKLRDFNVIHIVNKTEKTALVCNWLRPDPKLDCSTAKGFQLIEEHISNTLSLRILNVTKESAGVYKCQLVPSDRPPQTCTLEIVEDAQDNPQEIDSLSVITALQKLETKVELLVTFIVLVFIVCVLHLLGHLYKLCLRRNTIPRHDLCLGQCQSRAAYGETTEASEEGVRLNDTPRLHCCNNSSTATFQNASNQTLRHRKPCMTEASDRGNEGDLKMTGNVLETGQNGIQIVPEEPVGNPFDKIEHGT